MELEQKTVTGLTFHILVLCQPDLLLWDGLAVSADSLDSLGPFRPQSVSLSVLPSFRFLSLVVLITVFLSL